MEVAELALAPPNALPPASEDELAPTRSRINQVVHVIVTPHECLLLAEIEIAHAFN